MEHELSVPYGEPSRWPLYNQGAKCPPGGHDFFLAALVDIDVNPLKMDIILTVRTGHGDNFNGDQG
jgi:hypothetical protein